GDVDAAFARDEDLGRARWAARIQMRRGSRSPTNRIRTRRHIAFASLEIEDHCLLTRAQDVGSGAQIWLARENQADARPSGGAVREGTDEHSSARDGHRNAVDRSIDAGSLGCRDFASGIGTLDGVDIMHRLVPAYVVRATYESYQDGEQRNQPHV